MAADNAKTKAFYDNKPAQTTDSSGYRNYCAQIKAAQPNLALFLGDLGVDIEKPHQLFYYEDPVSRTVDYTGCQYVVLGTPEEDFPREIGDGTLRVADCYPDTGLHEPHFVLEWGPVTLPMTAGPGETGKADKVGQTLKKRFKAFLSSLCSLPLYIVYGIGCLFYLPVDYLRFMFSTFHRETGRGYVGLITLTRPFRVFNAFKKAGKPLGFHPCGDALLTEGGYFVTGHYAVVPGAPLTYSRETGDWCCATDAEGVPLDRVCREELSRCSTLGEDSVCHRMVLLVDRSAVPAGAPLELENATLLPVEDKKEAAAIRAFCGK